MSIIRTTFQHLVQWRFIALFVVAICVVAAWWFREPLPVDRSLDRMFANDNQAAIAFRKNKVLFGGDEIVILFYRDEQLFAKDRRGIRRLKTIVDQIHNKQTGEKLAGVSSTLSLLDADRMLTGAELLKAIPAAMFQFSDAKKVADDMFLPAGVVSDDPLAKQALETFAGYTHSPDGKTSAVVCVLTPEAESPIPRAQTIANLRSIAATLDSGAVIGEPVMVADGFRFIADDGVRLTWWSTILLAMVIGVCFRSLRWVLIPLVVVHSVIAVSEAAIGWLGMHQTMVSSMLTAIVTVIGVAAAMHVIVRFRSLRKQGITGSSAMVETLTLVAFPTLLACITDAVGFISLCVSGVAPVRDFGVMTALGGLLVFPALMLITPGLAFLGPFDQDPKPTWGGGAIQWVLRRLGDFSRSNPIPLLLFLFAAFVLGGIGLARMEFETDFTRNFRSSADIVRSYKLVEQHFGGAGVWDVALPAPKKLTNQYLQQVGEFEAELRSIPPHSGRRAALSKVVGLVDIDAIVVALLKRAESKLADFSQPIVAGVLRTVFKGLIDSPEDRFQLMHDSLPEFLDALRGAGADENGEYWLRISLRSPERVSSEAKLSLIQSVEEAAARYSQRDEFKTPARVSGIYILLATLVESLVADQRLMFLCAAIGLLLVLAMAFRSFLQAVIGLIPNVLPVVVLLGGMGLIGWKVNMGAAMIAAVSMGLSIDSSVHYLTMFRRAIRQGNSPRAAIGRAQRSVGEAAVLATIALMVGFTVLVVSNFIPTIYFGVLVSLAMLGGLFGNLVILPMLLSLVYGRN